MMMLSVQGVVAQQPARHAAKGVAHVGAVPMAAFGRPKNQFVQNVVRCKAAEVESIPVTNSPNPSYEGVADTYAVVDIGGHQLIVEEGRWYSVNRLEAEPGSKIQLGRVLALKSAGEFKVGKPYLEGITVEAEIMEEMKGPKVTVYKMKPKKHYRRTNGHRQPLTKFLVTKIGQ
ncbi:hypothetical protein M9435_006956 [Picochlorum sp. BPE23]|nr:hypothetical protein M9435_006956 [Picochlorum sp. BPE23]